MSQATAGRVAVDTSVAVPLLVRPHAAHDLVRRWVRGREIVLAGHAALETYAVLTRLPVELRVGPDEALRVVEAAFGATVHPHAATVTSLLPTLAAAGISGGAAYDAVVALAARDAGLPLATRDARAGATYRAVGVEVTPVG